AAPPPAAPEKPVEEIVITGSRIVVPNLQSISPVSTISSADIEQTGKTRVEDILNSMPQIFAAQGAQVSNGSNGIATVNLRGLGSPGIVRLQRLHPELRRYLQLRWLDDHCTAVFERAIPTARSDERSTDRAECHVPCRWVAADISEHHGVRGSTSLQFRSAQ